MRPMSHGFDVFEPALSSRRLASMSLIALLHVGLIYALVVMLNREPLHASPQEVFATVIMPQPSRPQPSQPTPKLLSVPLKTVVPEVPKMPEIPKVIDQKITAQPDAPPSPVAPPSDPRPAASSATEQAAPSQPAPPAPPAPPAQPRTITSGVEYIRPPRAEYPSGSRRMGEEGKVLLRVLVNEKGMAERIEIQTSSGSARLDEAGRQAVQRAVFKPYIDNGRPVPVFVIVPIAFQLS
jgi:periplasmic protein TonB